MKILLVSASSPFDESYGGAQRSRHLYRALREHGDVDVLLLEEGESFSVQPGKHAGELARLSFACGKWYRKYAPCPQVQEWASRHLGRYDLVVGRALTPVSKLGEIAGARRILDLDDALYRYVPSGDAAAARLKAYAKTLARSALLKRHIVDFDHVWFATEPDLRSFPARSASLLPNIMPGSMQEYVAPPDNKTILFVGALWYDPNRDAADWFLSHCWERIRAEVPGASLRLVGSCPPAQREQWSRMPGVSALGFVPDLAAEYRAASFTVSPIRFGGGTQIKVLESLAHGRASVVSRFVFERYAGAFTRGQSLAVGESADDMVQACVSLLLDKSLAERIALGGRRVVASNFDWGAFRTGVDKGIALAMPVSSATRPAEAEQPGRPVRQTV